jgi:hypothetical protein
MKVEYNPWKRLEIRGYLAFNSIEEFANFVAAPAPPGMGGMTGALWADGVVFRHTPLNPAIVGIGAELLEGNVIWDAAEFALMPKHVPELHPSSKPAFTINVVNVSGNKLFDDFAKWAKSTRKRSKE